MAGSSERTALAEVSEGVGWQRRVDERVDIYVRGLVRVRVIWQGDDAISGGSRFQDDVMESYSRDLTTVKGWLSR
ncbi:MAG: hypothetical protein QOJ80_6545 [Mycobacterium sp.]|jgi:hypothetical protein|nr:hypothetical protein [Mycobacterium sp.]